MKPFLATFIVFTIFACATPMLAQAQSNVTATAIKVGIRNCTQTQKGNTLAISCDFTNRGDVQPDIKYSIQLRAQKDGVQSLVDEKVYSDTLTLPAQQTVHKDISYTIPASMSGAVQVWIKASNSEGVSLSLIKIGDVTATGSENAVAIDTSTCYVTLKGEDDTKYSLIQGVDIAASETLVAHCKLTNSGSKSATLTPILETHRRNVFGEKVDVQNPTNPAVTLEAGKTADYSFSLPHPTDPQAYDTTFTLAMNGNPVSNTVAMHYVIRGASGTVQNITADKNSYAVGDTAVIAVMWSGSADNFPGARASSTAPKVASMYASISQGSKVCGETTQKIDAAQVGTNTLSVPIQKGCKNPQILVRLLDANGNILAEKSVGLESDSSSVADFLHSKVFYISVFIGGLLASLAAAYYLYRRRRGQSLQMPLTSSSSTPPPTSILSIFFLIAAVGFGFLHGAPQAHADVFNGGGYLFTVDIDKDVYSPGENMVVTGSSETATCANGYNTFTQTTATNLGTGQSTYSFENQVSYEGTCSGGCYISTTYYVGSTNMTAPTTPGTYTMQFVGTVMDWVGNGSYTYDITYTVAAPPPPPPAPPSYMNYSCNAAGTQATMSWNSVSGASSYYSRLSNVDAGAQIYSSDNLGGTSIVYDITPGVRYQGWVHSYNPSGWSSPTYSAVFSCAPPPPAPPTNLTATCAANAQSVTLQWNPVSGANNYYVRLLNNNTGAYDNSDGYTGTSIVKNVTPGQNYSWWVHSNRGAADYNPANYSAQTYGSNIVCTVATAPDLVAGSVSPTVATVGTALTLSAGLSNSGSAGTGSGFTNLFQRATDAAGTGATNIGTHWSNALAASQGDTAVVSYTFPSAGVWYVRTCADTYGNVAESNEGNNCGSWTAVWVLTKAPASITATCNAAGTNATLSWPAASGATAYYPRIGAPSSSQCTGFGWQLWTDGTTCYPNPDSGWGGATTVSNFPVTPGQTYNIWVHSGSSAGVNWAASANSSFTCADSNQPPVGYMDGASCTINGWAYDPNTPSQSMGVHLYAGGQAGVGGTYIGQTNTGQSRPDITASPNSGWSFAVPAAYQDGLPHPVYAYGIDTQDGTGAHNSQLKFPGGAYSPPLSFTCTAPAADLTAGAISPISATAGTPVTLTSTASNIGTGASGSFPILFQVQSPADLKNSAYLAGIPASGSGSGSISYTFPSGGTYQVRACANNNTSWVNIVTESNYANNCGPWTTITVAAAVPPVCSFTATPTTSVPSTLNWSCTNATSCTGGGFSTGNATNGSQSVATAGSYTLSCTGPGGNTSNSVTVAACTSPTPTITASPARIQSGQTTSITYGATGSTACTITGPGAPVVTPAACTLANGSFTTPALTTQTTYTITCDGVAKSVTVNVVPKFTEF